MSSRLRALALVCTLPPSPKDSSSQLLAEQVLDALAKHDVGVTQRVLERLDAELSETDDAGRPVMYGKDLEETPEAVRSATDMLASNAAHLAGLLQGHQYSPA